MEPRQRLERFMLRQRLERFMLRLNELRSRRMLQPGHGLGFSLTINREPDGPIDAKASTQLPDEEELRSFLVDFRKFLSERDPVFANGIYGIAYKSLPSDSELRADLAEWRKSWDQVQATTTVGITLGEQPIPPGKLADLWINGYYLHNDEAKYDQLVSLFDNIAPAKVNFLNYVNNATVELDRLGQLIRRGFDEGLFRF